jgi:acyl-CoA hydrolase
VLVGLGDRRGLRIWSEMFSDGVLPLVERESLDPDVLLKASFVFGTSDLYDFVNLNTSVRMMRTETTTAPLVAFQSEPIRDRPPPRRTRDFFPALRDRQRTRNRTRFRTHGR